MQNIKENVIGGIPRSEYPRPQFVRPDWLSLNGEWEFAFDDSNQGLTQKWSDGRALDSRITVPFAYQTELSGLNDKGVHERVWYSRSFEVPAEWREGSDPSDVLLHFGAVDYRTQVWVNGQEVGHNQGGHVPFWFDIAPYLKDGTNRLTLRVEDFQDSHQPRGKQALSALPKGCVYYCTTGIWQSVWLEPAPPVRIDDLRLTPFARTNPEEDGVEVRVYLHAPAAGWRVQAEALDRDRVVASTEDEAGMGGVRLVLRIPHSKRWAPDDPFLYTLRVRLLHGDEVLDEVESYTGIRTVQLKNGQMLLNGAPTYLAMVLDQGYWPESGMTAPTDEALRADVEWCKKFGFNGARKHQKVEDPRWLYWCDKIGLLVWGEMANARSWSVKAEEWFLAEWERAVRRDVNHPCIVTWVPINESWGTPDLGKDHVGQYAFLERLVALTRRLDPERPVIDNDGWEHTDVSDICAIHDYTVEPEQLRERYAETIRTGEPPAKSWGKWPIKYFARGGRFRGQPIVLSEVGGLLMTPELPEDKWDSLYGIYGSCRTGEELLQKYKLLMECLAEFKFMSGFCYTQLTDIEQEINGLLTYDRQPKIDPEEVRRIHERLFGTGGGKRDGCAMI